MIRASLFGAAVAAMAWAGVTATEAGPLPPELPPAPTLVVPAGGCHGDVQTHYVPEVAGALPHYHVGSNCRPIAAQGGQPGAVQQDCHADVRLHFVPGYGEIYHAHRGANCAVQPYEPSQGPPQPGCIQIGPVRVCP